MTEPSVDMATLAQANKKNLDLSTSIESTPEQFFTPLSFIKTYPKKSFRHNIVKNLEEEFSTPRSSTDKDNRNETEMKGIPAEKPGKSLIKEAKVKGDMLKEVKSKVREETPKVKEEKLKIKEEKDENATGKGRISRTAAKDLMNVPGISRTRKDNKRTLIRAVSPGKMKTRKDDKK